MCFESPSLTQSQKNHLHKINEKSIAIKSTESVKAREVMATSNSNEVVQTTRIKLDTQKRQILITHFTKPITRNQCHMCSLSGTNAIIFSKAT